MGYIYKITNKINQKIYIGLTRDTIEERWKNHIKKAKEYPNRYLYDAMNHYGYENFTIEEIESCDNSILDEREIYWISYYNSTNPDIGYNLTSGGGGGNTWKLNSHKLETGEKIRQAHLGENYVPITKEALEKDILNKLTMEEICQKYHCSHVTLSRRCKEFFGQYLSELRTIDNSGQFVKIDINKEQLYKDIVECKLTIEEIGQKYFVSASTITNRSKEYFGKTPREIRGTIIQKKEREYQNYEQLCLDRKARAQKGSESPVFITINYQELEEYLQNNQNSTCEQTALIFNMSKPTLIKRIKEKYQMTFKEYKNYVKSKN